MITCIFVPGLCILVTFIYNLFKKNKCVFILFFQITTNLIVMVITNVTIIIQIQLTMLRIRSKNIKMLLFISSSQIYIH